MKENVSGCFFLNTVYYTSPRIYYRHTRRINRRYMRHRSLKHEPGITTIMGCVFHDMMSSVFANLPFCSVKKLKNMYATTDIIVNRVIN